MRSSKKEMCKISFEKKTHPNASAISKKKYQLKKGKFSTGDRSRNELDAVNCELPLTSWKMQK